MTDFVACDLVTGEQLDAIPFRSFSHTKTLGGPGAWSATIEHDHPAISGVNARRLDTNRRAIFVIDGTEPPLFGGIVRQPGADLTDQGNEDLNVGGDGLWGYVRGDGSTTGRFWIGANFTYHLSHVLDTITSLWAQSALGGGIALQLVTSAARGPVHPDLVMLQADAANFGTTIEQLCTDYLVQFDTDYGWDTSDPHHWIPFGKQHFQFPRRGRDLNLTLEHGVNCDAISWTADAFQQANQIIGFGAGTLRTVQTAAPGSYPRVQALLHRKDITTQTRLDTAAQAQLAARMNPVRTVRVVVKQDARGITPRTMDTGDTVLLELDSGFIQEHGERWRVDSVQVDYDTEGQPTITTNLSSGTIDSTTGAVIIPGAVELPAKAIIYKIRDIAVRAAQLERF